MKQIILSFVAVFILALIGMGVYNLTLLYSSRPSNVKTEAAELTESEIIKAEEETKTTSLEVNLDEKIYDLSIEDNLYDLMHKMANTQIVAEDGQVWGEVEITEEKVDALIEVVNLASYDDKEKILEILNRWREKDFSQCVDEHNYFWAKLGGSMGKATALINE